METEIKKSKEETDRLRSELARPKPADNIPLDLLRLIAFSSGGGMGMGGMMMPPPSHMHGMGMGGMSDGFGSMSFDNQGRSSRGSSGSRSSVGSVVGPLRKDGKPDRRYAVNKQLEK
jgi:hypothetical protein